MSVERKTAQKVLNKVIDAGFGDEKSIAAMSTEEIIAIPGITLAEISVIMQLQKAIKGNRVITFLAGNEGVSEHGK